MMTASGTSRGPSSTCRSGPNEEVVGLLRRARCGMEARIPTVIKSETPLPIPRVVICSPSHIMRSVPAVMKITEVIRKLVCPTKTIEP